jgi:hypothetical protein
LCDQFSVSVTLCDLDSTFASQFMLLLLRHV